MNRQGNRRTKTEGPSNLRLQNSSLQKNRSWPRTHGATGQQQAASETLLDFGRNFAAIPPGAEGHGDNDYEDPKLHVTEAWQAMKVLPARPIKESEYADTRYFKGMDDTPLSLGAFPSVPAEGQTWTTQTRPEEVDKPISMSKDIRSQHVTGANLAKGNKMPLPPPRPPVVPVPKKYQPLPPEPESSSRPVPQRPTLPEAQRGPRQINLKNLSEVLGTEEVSHHQMKPESSHWSQNQSAPEIPLATASSSSMMSSHGVQSRDQKRSVPCHSPQRRPFPEHAVHYKNVNWTKPVLSSEEEEASQSNWYVGEYSRQAVEEALIKENKDGTFLVRDCSARSCTEPYVLVVFHGNKVYNVKIRFLERNQQFALGTGLRGDEKFNSVEDIIEHYKYFPIVLVDGKDKTGTHKKQCYLAQPLPLHRLFSP
uniref:Cytokine dependent hematopoietic cell linker n=1 Tax=Molossus molossus TaxID=27622 RepID=A0A7J8JRX3_MOLMO|nr:cytokine dependent hematopoietic cell linker [Molossus molossus]